MGEWRPSSCNTRLGDIHTDRDGNKFLVIRCRRCSHTANKDIFHSIQLWPSLAYSGAKLHRTDKP